MSSVEPEVMRSLLDEVKRLECELKEGGDMKTARLHEQRINEIKAELMEGSAFDGRWWSQLSADKQKDLFERLARLRADLLAAKIDACHSTGYSPKDGGSKPSIIWLAIFASIFAATLLSLIR